MTPRELSEELAGAELSDVRLSRRLGWLVEKLAEAPSESFPCRAGGDSELEATYRFLSNSKVRPELILAPHIDATVERARRWSTVVVPHDTTEFLFPGESDCGLGRLRTGKNGFLGHFALVVGVSGEDREPLGMGGMHLLFRDGKRKPRTSPQKRRYDEDNENQRWWTLVQEVDQRLDERTRAVHVMDREADSFMLLSRMVGGGHRFVVRMNFDRVLVSGEQMPRKLKDALALAPCVVSREVPLSTRRPSPLPRSRQIHPPRNSRLAKLTFSSTSVALRRPDFAPAVAKEFPESVKVNVVHVKEIEPPTGCEPVEWKLVTSEPIETAEQVLAIIDFYRARWLIEEYFKALKTGCAVEKRQLESRHAIVNALAVFAPIAWRLLRIRGLAQLDPDSPASGVLPSTQLQILKTCPLLSGVDRPTVSQAFLAIAALGGHIKNNGAPGWQVLGRGYEKLLEREQGWLAALATNRRPRDDM